MIKNSVKTFFKNIVNLFIPMGIVYLFMLMAIFMFVSAVGKNIGQTITDLSSLINVSIQASSVDINDFLSYAFGQIDWNASIADTVKQIIDTDWLQNTVKGFFATLDASAVGFEVQFRAIIVTFKNKLIADIIGAAVIIVIGIIIAIFVTRYAVRRKSAKRNIKKFFIAHTVVPVFQSLIIILFFVLLSTIKLYSFPVMLVPLTLAAIISICSSWAIHKDDSLKLKEVLTVKNIFEYIGVVATILILNIIVMFILIFINPLLALLIMIPFVIYSFCIVDVNTDAYVVSLIAQRRTESDPVKNKPSHKNVALSAEYSNNHTAIESEEEPIGKITDEPDDESEQNIVN